jgi:Cupin-like domain
MREEFVPVRRVLELMTSDASSSTGSMYMAQHPLSTYMPVLCSDFEVPVWTVAAGDDAKVNAVINFWLGSAETGSRLHYDSQDNLLVQAVGRKRVTLFGADQTPFLHVDDEALVNFSPVNVDSPDLIVHNQFGNAVGTTTMLNPGDALYIPAGVWHWVRCIEPSISVNFWF